MYCENKCGEGNIEPTNACIPTNLLKQMGIGLQGINILPMWNIK